MSVRKAIIPILLTYLLMSCACKYIVLPEGLDIGGEGGQGTTGWSAVATHIAKSDSGALRIELVIRNGTGDWSAMKANEGAPAVLSGGGKTINCDTVFISTGGHRLAPGFQMRGYTAGTRQEPVIQPIYVECAGAEPAADSRLSIPYTYVTGQYNYYEQDKNKVEAVLEVDLSQVASDLQYPLFEEVEGLIQKPEVEMVAINKVILSLTDIQRTEKGLQFSWKTVNPGEYASYVHIGVPPVIGEDGILYGYYETPDIVSVPITPAQGQAEWTTEVAVPQDVGGFYIMLSVETGKARLFANYAIDITDR